MGSLRATVRRANRCCSLAHLNLKFQMRTNLEKNRFRKQNVRCSLSTCSTGRLVSLKPEIRVPAPPFPSRFSSSSCNEWRCAGSFLFFSTPRHFPQCCKLINTSPRLNLATKRKSANNILWRPARLELPSTSFTTRYRR